MPSRHYLLEFPGLAAWLVLLAGCATHADRLREVRMPFYEGRVAEAAAAIDRHLARNGNDADVLKLDRAVVELTAGRPREAEQTLRGVRDRFDFLEQESLGEKAFSYLTDDNVVAYAGEDYEKVLVRAFLALSNLMTDGGDAVAYGLQTTDKQDQIIQAGVDKEGENPKLSYKRVALGAYIHGALCEETNANYDDAARSWAKVVSWEPSYPYGQRDVERAVGGRHSQRGNGVLYVFTLVGRGPYKVESLEVPTTVALLIADRIVSSVTKRSLPPTIAPIKVPKVVLSVNRIRNVNVSVDGKPVARTETITDVGDLAVQQYEAIYPQVIGRAVARRVVKKGVVYGAKEAIKVDNPWVNLAMDAGGVVWEATEKADLRCWGLLPDKIQVLRLELPAGEHHIGLRAANGSSILGAESGRTVRIADGRNTYLMASFPDDRLVGEIMTNQESEPAPATVGMAR
ncbi:MAG: COG3014 family protein [Pirellulales bacterium]